MRVLKLNTLGEAVVYLHKLLNQAGSNLHPSQLFDERTEIAVKNFQEKNNLVVDGIVYTKNMEGFVKQQTRKYDRNGATKVWTSAQSSWKTSTHVSRIRL